MRTTKRGTASAVKTKPCAQSVGHEELDLRKWCVETAIRFPSALDMTSFQQYPSVRSTQRNDVLADAQRIYTWVTRE